MNSSQLLIQFTELWFTPSPILQETPSLQSSFSRRWYVQIEICRVWLKDRKK